MVQIYFKTFIKILFITNFLAFFFYFSIFPYGLRIQERKCMRIRKSQPLYKQITWRVGCLRRSRHMILAF